MTATHWAKKAKAGKKLKPRDENDHYPTPLTHVRFALARYAELFPYQTLDIGTGAGVWGEEARRLWADTILYGVETRRNVPKNNAYNRLIYGDFLTLGGNRPTFDFICSNPPYSLSEPIIRKAFTLLMPEGYMVMLFRLQFLSSVKRFLFWTKDCRPYEVTVFSDRPSFSGDGNTDSDDYMLVHWRKGYAGKTELTWGIADEGKRERGSVRQEKLF